MLSVGRMRGMSVSSSRSTGHLPLPVSLSVPEEMSSQDSTGDAEVDREVEDIRRRRTEVTKRYEARLEFLRAKLKGAEIHEKLLKK